MAELKNIDIDTIEARANAATPGPWKHKEGTLVWFGTILVSRSWFGREADGVADAEFIAHAREDIPALIASHREKDVEIAKLHAQVSSLEQVCVEFRAESARRLQLAVGRMDAILDRKVDE